MKVDDLVILVGGRGSRLGKLTNITPKPLIKINNKPFLEHLLGKIIKYNFKKVYLLCSYKKFKFFNLCHNKKIHNSKIICVDEGAPKGTGGALFKLKKKINKNFILINGDTFFDINLNDLIDCNLGNNLAKICLTHIKNSHNNTIFTNLKLNANNKLNFSSKKTKLMNGGVYLFNKKIFNYIDDKKKSLENDILHKLILKKRVIASFYNDKFIDIGSIKKLNYIKNKNKFLENKAVFLDRDGVINKHTGYILSYNKFRFLNGVQEAIKYANDKKYLVIVVTNQSAIGRSLLSENDLSKIHSKMKKEIYKNNKACIDDIFYSTYYVKSKIKKYKLFKNDRKPGNGMFIKAAKKWNIDISASIFIGDQITDKQAAINSKIKFFFKKKYSLYKQLKSII